MKQQVLLIDDDPSILDFYALALNRLENVGVFKATSGAQSLELIEKENIDLIFLDLRLPDIEGIDLLRTIRKVEPELFVVLLTGYPNLDTAIESMKLGASDYLIKPIKPPEIIKITERLLATQRLQAENRLLQHCIERRYQSHNDIIGQGESIQSLIHKATRTAETDFDVLLTGDTGTGKELFARLIHKQSQRANKRFVPVDCGTIPEALFESELFGHERGAFTGAVQKKMGLIEFSDEGTLFLDEIGELPLSLQAKLLRALQERTIRHVGSYKEIPVNTRIVAATNRDLLDEVKKKRFREDLYYRLSATQLSLPPLKDRGNDIDELTKHYVQFYSQQLRRPTPSIADDLLESFRRYSWPGNVRELQNVIRQMLVMTDDEFNAEFAPDHILGTHPAPITHDGVQGYFTKRELYLSDFEKNY
ncbi:MAG: sigma-54 dependent transcriptional regulator, partial [Planctomycetota bacterium]|nr:sigma-54 dependent transcriptional regulator [Planctomycetota bacterium]